MSSPLFRSAQEQPGSAFQQQGPGGGGPIHLVSKDGLLVSYQAKWTDLHPHSQQLLLQIEERVQEYREESRQLEQKDRGSNFAALHKGFEFDAARISQELGGVAGAVIREAAAVRGGQAEASQQLLRQTEVAVRTFLVLQPRFGAMQAAVLDFFSTLPAKPSPFLQQTVARFERLLSKYQQRIEELERLLLLATGKENSYGSQLSLLHSLPTVMTNVHDFFIHVAAEVESLHQHMGAVRSAYLTERRRHGDDSNPFLEAERRAMAQRDAAERRVLHPTLHLSPLPAPNAPPGSTPGPSPFGALQAQPTPTASPLSLFGTPATSTPSLFGSGAATASGITATSSPSLFGSSFSVPALPAPGSSPAASGGLFGTPTPASTGLFGTPTVGSTLLGGAPSSAPVFSTPALPAFGATNTGVPVFGIGSATGTAAVKPKPRGTRRR